MTDNPKNIKPVALTQACKQRLTVLLISWRRLRAFITIVINSMVYAAAEVKSSPLEAVIMIVGLLDMAESGACARTHVHAAAKLIM